MSERSPVYYPFDWSVVPVQLSADELVALNMMAFRDRLDREELASRLVALALMEQRFLPLDWAAVEAWRNERAALYEHRAALTPPGRVVDVD